ncbi:porin [Vibrio sp. WXL103]|uniref:porin n=1 Tax=Vibrio sp. WXL103 TaxID=3450710 RepID=UPI003EC874E2
MKTSAVASALLLALASTSTVAATVYSNDGTELSVGGRVEFRGDIQSDDDASIADKTRARLNVKGSSKISEGLTAFGFYENEQNSGDSALSNRYMFAGLDTDFGAFSAGKQDQGAVLVSGMSDITTFSGNNQNIGASKDKTDGVLAYNASFDALQVSVSYAGSNDEDAISAAAMYSLPVGLDLGLGYSAQDDANEIIAGVAFSMDALYVAGNFGTGEGDDGLDFTTIEFAGEYKVMPNLALQAYYLNKDVDGDTTADNAELGAVYRFNSNLRTYAAYDFDLDDSDNSKLRLGLRYDF